MSNKSVAVVIALITFWIYFAVVNKTADLTEIPTWLLAAILLVLLLGLYAFLVVRESKSYSKKLIADLQAHYSSLFVGVSLNTKCVVAASPDGITIMKLNKKMNAVELSLTIPYGDIEMVAPPVAMTTYSDRGAAVVIRRKSDGWIYAAGLMTPEDARGMTMFGYLSSRLNRSSTNGKVIIDKLMEPESRATTSSGAAMVETDKSVSEALSPKLFKLMLIVTVGTFLGIMMAIFLSFATLFFIDDTFHREMSAPFTQCVRNPSNITALPVNKTVSSTEGTMTVHKVTYNVPQEAEHPTEDSSGWRCEKATLVKVTLTNSSAEPNGILGMRHYVSMRNDSEKARGTIYPDSNNADEFDHYAEKEDLRIIDNTVAEEQKTQTGWLVFSFDETVSNDSSFLVYGDKHPFDKNELVQLPNPKQ